MPSQIKALGEMYVGRGCICLMSGWCGMDAIHATDHIILMVFIKQHTAIDTKTIGGGVDFHGQVAPAGNTFPLYIQGGFAGVIIKELNQIIDVQHWCFPVTIWGRFPYLRIEWLP